MEKDMAQSIQQSEMITNLLLFGIVAGATTVVIAFAITAIFPACALGLTVMAFYRRGIWLLPYLLAAACLFALFPESVLAASYLAGALVAAGLDLILRVHNRRTSKSLST